MPGHVDRRRAQCRGDAAVGRPSRTPDAWKGCPSAARCRRGMPHRPAAPHAADDGEGASPANTGRDRMVFGQSVMGRSPTDKNILPPKHVSPFLPRLLPDLTEPASALAAKAFSRPNTTYLIHILREKTTFGADGAGPKPPAVGMRPGIGPGRRLSDAARSVRPARPAPPHRECGTARARAPASDRWKSSRRHEWAGPGSPPAPGRSAGRRPGTRWRRCWPCRRR